MRRGTTESKNVTLSGDVDFSQVRRAVITIKQGSSRIHQDIVFDSEGKGTVTFTPDQTLMLRSGECFVQVKLALDDGTVLASDIVTDVVNGDVLNEEEI